MTQWPKGRDVIDDLVADKRMQRITPSASVARLMVEEARRHLRSADAIADTDPGGAYALVYDAARKGMAAVFEAQGLRATALGGHVVLHDAAAAQFDPPLGHLFRPFNRLRVRRNEVEYASLENPAVEPSEVREALAKAHRLLDDFVEVILSNLDQLGG